MRTLRRWVYWHILVRFNRIAADAFTRSDDLMMAFLNADRAKPLPPSVQNDPQDRTKGAARGVLDL